MRADSNPTDQAQRHWERKLNGKPRAFTTRECEFDPRRFQYFLYYKISQSEAESKAFLTHSDSLSPDFATAASILSLSATLSLACMRSDFALSFGTLGLPITIFFFVIQKVFDSLYFL